MRYYPAFLDVKNRRCLVVGGGQVGTRKAKTLLMCGAKVVVISLKATQELERLSNDKQIELHLRSFEDCDLENTFLVIGATDNPSLNHQIYEQAELMGRLCNIADQPQLCNFVLPSIVNQGDLTIAVSTAGQSPAFAKHLRRCLQRQFGPEYGYFLKLMGSIRMRLLKVEHAPEAHKSLFEQLIAGGLLDMIKEEKKQEIDALLGQVLGSGYHYDQLMSESR